MLEQVVDRHRQVVVRIHQTCRSDDTVTVIIRVVSKRQIELITQCQQTRHRTLGGAVHTDRTVFIEVHKAEGLIDLIVNDGQVEVVILANALPVFDTGTAQRINAQRQARFLNRRHINDIGQPFHERLHQILLFHMTGCHRFVEGDTLHAFQAIGHQCVGPVFHHFGDVSISRATIWRIVLDTTIFRRVMGRCNHDTVCQRATFFIVNQDGIGNGRRRSEAIVFLHNDINAVRCQHFQYGNERRLGQGVSIFTHIARASDAVFRTFFSNCLSDRQNVRLVKAVARCTATVTGSTEFHRVLRIPCFWFQYIILRRQLGDVNQITLLCRLACTIVDCHCFVLCLQRFR